jgi:hypothetical protein
MLTARTGSRRRKAFVVIAPCILACCFAGVLFSATAAHAAVPTTAPPAERCSHPTISFYPGNKVLHWRYGVASFHFDVCSGEPAPTWGKFVARISTNNTGSNLGVFLQSASVYATKLGSTTALYTGRIYWKECLADLGWPCYQSGDLDATFAASVARGRPSVRVLSTTESFGIVLFRTP